MEKADLVAAICAEIGVSMIPLGPGSKEKKAVFEAVIERLELPMGPASKPDLARQIAELGGQEWDETCESTGDTITAVGLQRVLLAVRDVRRRRGSLGARPRDQIGRPYEPLTGGVTAAPTELTLNWDELDASTRAHAELQNEVALLAQANGLTPLRAGPGDPPFDVAWWLDEIFVVIEVKSTNTLNTVQQVRLGLGQVLEYRQRLLDLLDGEVVAAIVASDPPGESLFSACGGAGVVLAERDRLGEQLQPLLRLE